jgi:hypothetical protein
MSEYPIREYTVELAYTVYIPDTRTETFTITADDEEDAVAMAWERVYNKEGVDDSDLDEGPVVIKKKRIVPDRGYEDDKTLAMFPAE